MVLLGATGFTGRLAAAHLARRLRGTTERWALAGRDRAALEALRATLPGSPAVEVADAGDPVGLLDLAGRTRVLASTVGPYARFGEPVVQACVRAGTDYCDLAGEPAFLERIATRYHAEARRRGVRLVPCCGFEAVPPDLGVQLAVAQLPDDAPLEVRGYVRTTGGGFSGGTARTAVEAVAARRRSRADLLPADGVRPVAPLPPRLHRVPELHAWGVPLPTVDAAVVLASAATLPGYGTALRYGHHAAVRRLRTVAAGAAGAGALVALAWLPPTRALLRRALPASGQGPSPQRRSRARFTVTVLGRGGGRRVAVRVSGGDAGYDESAQMLGEAALSLAFDAGDPVAAGAVGAVGGLRTPAALGAAYRARLDAQGIRFAVLPTPPT